MYLLQHVAFLSWVPAVGFIHSLIQSFSYNIDYYVAASELTLRNVNMNIIWSLPLMNKSLMVGF